MALAEQQNADVVRELLALLEGKQAHVDLARATNNFPAEMRGVVPEKLPYSAWQLVEHLRITQRDILTFSAPPTGGYQPMEWPTNYWPDSAEPPHEHAWDETLAAIRSDQKKFEALLTRTGADLYKPFRWGDGQNLLREAMLIADHNAYHLGELVVIRRLLGIWE